jgi:DNA-binding response OmpR family regulator
MLGADGYVTKPYTRNVVADVIRRVLKQENP